MMLLACMFTVLLQGMENNTLSFLIDQTMVKLTKGSMFDADDSKFDFMIVGRVQQRRLQEPNFGDSSQVGRIDEVANNMVYIKNKDDESASDDDMYKPYKTDYCDLWKRAHAKAMRSRVLSVVEPRIILESFGTFQSWYYYAERMHSNRLVELRCGGDDKTIVFEAASEDLARCYHNAFERVGPGQSIAIPELGTDVGFPREEAVPVVVNAIMKYIKTSVKDGGVKPCELIHLFVKKHSAFTRYEELLAQYAVEQK